jgi:hypothetical protein
MPSLRKLLENPLFCALLAIGLVACHRTPDEKADASALDALLSDDFSGNNGEMEHRQIVGLLRAARFRGETIHALTGPIEVEARGGRYVARFTVTLTSGGKLLPAQIGVYRVETAWRKEGREWKCYSATWTSSG